jgi:hypothetical protein
MRRSLPLTAITLLFVSTITGAWAWFHIAPTQDFERLRFEVGSEVEGWRFAPEPVSDAVKQTLATTRLLNGSFSAEPDRRVTVFAAEWRANDQHTLSVVQHTPDICWVGIGLAPVDAGQPDRIQLNLAGRAFPFECRVFSVPGGRAKELVVWCTLLSGQVMEESGRWRIEEDAAASSAERFHWASRRLALGQLARNVLARRPAAGHKQFVRLSAPFQSSWKDSLDELRAFIPKWIQVHTEPGHQP